MTIQNRVKKISSDGLAGLLEEVLNLLFLHREKDAVREKTNINIWPVKAIMYLDNSYHDVFS